MEATQDILSGLDVLDQKITALTEDRKASESAIKSELAKLGDQQVGFVKELQEIRQNGVKLNDAATAGRSVGEMFASCKSYQNLNQNNRAFGSFEFKKDATTGAGAVVPQNVNRVIGLPDESVRVEDLIPHVSTNSNAVEYVQNTNFSNNAAATAEGAAKPESTFEFKLKTVNISTVAHWTKITRQLVQDSLAVATYINAKMLYGLQNKTEDYILNDSTAGLLVNASDYSKTAGVNSSDTLVDFVLKIKGALEAELYPPRYLILNPADWVSLSLLKDGQKRYLLGNPAAITEKKLWGLDVVTTANISSGKYILADFALGAAIYDRQAVEVALSESDDTNFQQNLYTLRVERRLGLGIDQKGAIGGGNFAIEVN